MAVEAARIVVPIEVQMAALDSRLREAEAKVAASTNRMNRRGGGQIVPGGVGGFRQDVRFLRSAVGGFGLVGLATMAERVLDEMMASFKKMDEALQKAADEGSVMGSIGAIGRNIPFFGGLLERIGSMMFGQTSQAEMEKIFGELGSFEIQISEMTKALDLQRRILEESDPAKKLLLENERDVKAAADELSRVTNKFHEMLKATGIEWPSVEQSKMLHDLFQAIMGLANAPYNEGMKKLSESKVGRDEFQTPFGMWRVLQQSGDFSTQEQPKETTQREVKINTAKTAAIAERIAQTFQRMQGSFGFF